MSRIIVCKLVRVRIVDHCRSPNGISRFQSRKYQVQSSFFLIQKLEQSESYLLT